MAASLQLPAPLVLLSRHSERAGSLGCRPAAARLPSGSEINSKSCFSLEICEGPKRSWTGSVVPNSPRRCWPMLLCDQEAQARSVLGIRKLCLSCRGDETRKARSVAKLERGPQVLCQANSAGGYQRYLQDRHQGESLRINQACGRIRHAGPSGRFGRRDSARRNYPVRRCALSENANFTRPAHDGLSKRDSTIGDRKSTRLNSSHLVISYAVFCLKKKKK